MTWFMTWFKSSMKSYTFRRSVESNSPPPTCLAHLHDVGLDRIKNGRRSFAKDVVGDLTCIKQTERRIICHRLPMCSSTFNVECFMRLIPYGYRIARMGYSSTVDRIFIYAPWLSLCEPCLRTGWNNVVRLWVVPWGVACGIAALESRRNWYSECPWGRQIHSASRPMSCKRGLLVLRIVPYCRFNCFLLKGCRLQGVSKKYDGIFFILDTEAYLTLTRKAQNSSKSMSPLLSWSISLSSSKARSSSKFIWITQQPRFHELRFMINAFLFFRWF